MSIPSSFGKIIPIAKSTFGRRIFVVSFFCVLAIIFLLDQYSVWMDVISGHFPFSLLIQTFPLVLYDFWYGTSYTFLAHYFFISFLLATYISLMIFLFVEKRFFSLASFGSSLLSLLGVSAGIFCLSCGALAGVLTFSILGLTASTVLLAINPIVFFYVAEVLLLISIVYIAIKMPKN